MKDLLDFSKLDRAQLEGILETAVVMAGVLERPVKKVPALQGFTVCTAFFENSTRTRLSFRHGASGAAHQVSKWTNAKVVNAGDGRRAHPTQALLDAYTLKQKFKSLEGLEVAIVGDVRHSRVARSNAELLPKLGARVRLCGPATLLPTELEADGVTVTTDIREAIEGAHAVMALRLQLERMSAGYLPSLKEYRDTYQVNAQRMVGARPDAVVLHPGPMNRDLEIESVLADSSRSLVLQQVANGLPVRMAVLYHLLVGKN